MLATRADLLFEDEDLKTAVDRIERIVASDPHLRGDLIIMAYDTRGHAIEVVWPIKD